MLTFFPFTRTWPCSTSWRACEREDARPARHTTLSRRRSSIMMRFSPVGPLARAAFSHALREAPQPEGPHWAPEREKRQYPEMARRGTGATGENLINTPERPPEHRVGRAGI